MTKRITKLFSLLALVALMSVCISINASAASYVTIDGIKYEYSTSDYTAYVDELADETLENISIPSSITVGITTYTVTSINLNAFNDCDSIISVTLPSTITSIGLSAFRYCDNLTTVDFGSAAVTLAGFVFASCPNLTTVKMSAVKNISYQAFYDCTSLTNFTIPDSVSEIDGGAFINCTGLTSIIIPSSVTSIGDFAFSICSNLSSITFNNGLTSIGASAFQNCDSLTSVTLPDSLTILDGAAFRFCDNLTTVDFGSAAVTLDGYVFASCPNLTTVKMSAVKNISYQAFYDCTSLTNFTIPDSVSVIDGGAFTNCTGLTSIIIPSSVTSIGDFAFSICSNLSSITFNNGLTSIGASAFQNCDSLTSVTFPDSLTFLDSAAFRFCDNLTTVDFANAAVELDSYVFDNCPNLTTVTMNAVLNIPYYTFNNCTSLTNFTIPDTVTSIGDNAFSSCESLTSIVIPDSVTYIGTYTFGSCTNLKSVVIGNSVSTIYKYAFNSCSSLTCVEIPSSVTTIGSSAFRNCDNLTDVYYTESESDWNSISISTTYNAGFTTATIHYNSTMPTTPDTVNNITVENGSTWLKLTWTAATNATGYQIYVDGTKVATLYDGETTYTVTGLSGGTDFDIQIRTFSKASGSAVFGDYSDTYTFTTNPFKASFSSYSNTYDAVRVNWNSVSGADGYRLYMYVDGVWETVATVGSSTLTYRIDGLDANSEYLFKVKAYTRDVDGTAQFGVSSNEYTASSKSTTVQLTTYTNTTSAIRINWSEISVADGYRIYLYKNGSWVNMGTVYGSDTTTFKLTGLDIGTTYLFKVKAFIRDSSGTAVWQDASDEYVTMTDLATAKITSSSKTSSAIRINWSSVNNATGYKIYMLVDGTWKTYDTIYEGDITTYKFTGLNSNTTYQFKICAFSKETGTTVWGTTSSVYSVTTSK